MHRWKEVHALSSLQGSNKIVFIFELSKEMALQHSKYESFQAKDEGIRFKLTTRCLKQLYIQFRCLKGRAQKSPHHHHLHFVWLDAS